MKIILSEQNIAEYNNSDTLVLYVSETLIPNKNGKDCSFVEYLCDNKYNLYKIENMKKNNYIITFNKNELKKDDLLNIAALIEYRESLYCFDDVDIFTLVKDLDNSVWDKYYKRFNDEISNLQSEESKYDFSSEKYNEIHNKLEEAVLLKYVCTESMGLPKDYASKQEFYNVLSISIKKNYSDMGKVAELLMENCVLPKIKKEAQLRKYLSNKIPYKLIKYELLKFENEEYKEYLKKIKEIRNEFYAKNDIYMIKYVSEWNLYKLVKENYENAMFQYSPEFLGNQRYDIYIPELKTAIEYQGEQHYHQIDFFGPIEEIQKRDEKKKQLSEENNIRLIYWKYDEKIDEKTLKEKIEN